MWLIGLDVGFLDDRCPGKRKENNFKTLFRIGLGLQQIVLFIKIKKLHNKLEEKQNVWSSISLKIGTNHLQAILNRFVWLT